MPAVLCFGDSNTWGYVPETGARLPRDLRWPGLLARALGEQWQVVEEGLNGRTATLDSPLAPGRNGLDYLVPCLHSHAPLDVVVIALGTNDLNERYSLSTGDVAAAVARLAAVVGRTPEAGVDGRPPNVVLACPPPLGSAAGEVAAAKSRSLAVHLGEQAELLGCALVDLGSVTAYSELDGIHLDVTGHHAVAAAVEPAVRKAAA